jgi:hypothetical protein
MSKIKNINSMGSLNYQLIQGKKKVEEKINVKKFL